MIWIEFDEFNPLDLSKHCVVTFLHVVFVSSNMGSVTVSSHVNVFSFKIINLIKSLIISIAYSRMAET